MNKALYGTRDAAQNWENEYREFLISEGFKAGISTPCVFWHPVRNVRVVVHGDDFTALGVRAQLDWFRGIMTKRFEVKFRGTLGPREQDEKSMRILNRVVEWTSRGIVYEADQRHAEIIIRELKLESESKSVVTPGIKNSDLVEDKDDGKLLNNEESSRYRAIAARANYLSQGRSDIL